MKDVRKRLFRVLCLVLCLIMIPLGVSCMASESLSRSKITVNKGSTFSVRVSGGLIFSGYYDEEYLKPVTVRTDYSIWKTLKTGETNLDIKTKSGNLLTCKVSIHGISEGDLSIIVGDSLGLHFYGGKPTWKSSDRRIVEVNRSGKIIAKKSGTAYVYAKANGKTYKCKVRVKNSPVKVLKKSLTIKVGKTAVLPIENIGTAKITYDKEGLKVSKGIRNGKVCYTVLGVRPGVWKVNAEYKGKKYSCTVTVPSYTTDIYKLTPKAPIEVRQKFVSTGGKVEYDGSLKGYIGVYRYLSNRIILKYTGDDTCYHELGHFLHFMGMGNTELNEESRYAYVLEKHLYKGNNPVYHTSDYIEYFAASFVDYCFKRNTLRVERPKTYKMLENYIKRINDLDEMVTIERRA